MRSLALVLAFALPGDGTDDLAGTQWEFVRSEFNRNTTTKKGLNLLLFRETGYSYDSSAPAGSLGGPFFKGRFATRGDGAIREIDLTSRDGVDLKDGRKVDTLLGIFAIEGDRLKVAFSRPGQPRPASFDSNEYVVEYWRHCVPRYAGPRGEQSGPSRGDSRGERPD